MAGRRRANCLEPLKQSLPFPFHGVQALHLAECLQFAGDGKVKVHYSTERLQDINSIFGRMRDNKIDGRVVMKI